MSIQSGPPGPVQQGSGQHGGALVSAAAVEVGTGRLPRLRGSTLLRHLLLAAVGLAVIFVLSQSFGAYRNLQAANVAYFAVAVAGLSVLTGLSGQISLGHGAFMAVGAYAAALTFGKPGWSLGLVLAFATVVTAAVGAAVGAAAARLRGPYLAGATLAFAIGLPALANYRGLTDTLGGDNGLVAATPPAPGTVPLDRWQLWVSGIALVLTFLLLANLSRSRIGRAWRALRDDEVSAALAGLHVARLQVLAFVVSAACAGLAGGLLAYVQGLAAPGAFTFALSLSLLTAAVLGGLGSLAGAVYGAIVLVVLPPAAASLAGGLGVSRNVYANLPLAVYGVVLALVMLTFPQGVQGGVRRILALLPLPGRRR